MSNWIESLNADTFVNEDVLRFDHGGNIDAINRSPDDKFYATDGRCTHEKLHLADGLVIDYIIECPKHNGRFDYSVGVDKGASLSVNLRTYPVKFEGGKIMIDVD